MAPLAALESTGARQHGGGNLRERTPFCTAGPRLGSGELMNSEASHPKTTRGRAAGSTASGGLAAIDISPSSDELLVSRHPDVVHSCSSVMFFFLPF